MVEIIYNHLRTPKTITELHQRLHESGIKWNEAQIELFLIMDSSIRKTGDLYSVEKNDSNNIIIIDAIEKAIEGKPLVPVKQIMRIISDNNISEEEIKKVAVQNGKYKIHPNGAVILKK